MLNIATSQTGETLVIALEGRIDAASAKHLEQQCLDLIEGGASRLVFDLGQVVYISSAGLRVFLVAAKRLPPEGSLKLCALNSTLRDVFEISGFSTLFQILPAVGDAL
ncbi:STAS domain-containing protein [Methylomagnum ishizawai]|uniref:STAS domain-containing protein n=1 Tax=Methylomagnum ishizawai TaxID=1760988 RepID=UPI001C329FA4|nr:STAS domain-containing protein [Methylomagnum ishizawai]BBL75535.1 anti-sigma factor antagonist [Methylomagnum ishizawai]